MSREPKRLAFVIPVYNVARYLPDLIASIERQSGGIDDLEVIAVEDGSTDDSLQILRGWEARRPDLVTVIAQRNGGVASARNAGLEIVTAPWVSFIDPDDVLEHHYLEAVVRFLDTRPDCAMVATRMVYLDDATRRLRDEHPLRYRFEGGSRVVDLGESPESFHTPVSCSFFPTSTLQELGLRFDTRIRPHFEDTHFTARFLLRAGPRIGFVAEARYLYRQRNDASSLSQGKHLDPRAFTTVPQFGYLPCLAEAATPAGSVPRWLQNVVLYSMTWQFASAERLEPSAAVGEVGAAYVKSIREVRRYLDDEAIEGFPVPQLSRLARDVLLHLNDDSDWHSHEAVIDRHDPAGGLERLLYHYKGRRPHESLTSGGHQVPVVHGKAQSVNWFGETVLSRRIAWIPLSRRLELRLDGDQAVVQKATGRPIGASPRSTLRDGAIAAIRATVHLATRVPHRFTGAWLLMDRTRVANDNAEHLFRHLRRHRPDVNAWFVLERDTPEWDRLASDGLGDRLLAHGSREWKLALLACTHAVSSRLDVDAAAPPRITRWRAMPARFAHLRHDLTSSTEWIALDSLPVDLLTVSSRGELEAITGDGTPSLLTEREVRLTGMPRLDRLLGLAAARADRDLLLVAPASHSQVREWSALLRSHQLAEVARRHGLRIAHLTQRSATPVADPNLDDAVLALHREGQDVQELLVRAALLITDDPALALDMGYIERPVVHLQFDRGDTVGARDGDGWFAFSGGALGPLTGSVDDALDAVHAAAERGFEMEELYRRRAEELLPLRDGRCCARATSAIEASATRSRLARDETRGEW